ncbi:uncharacterized protein FIESC28_01468 [Fusarium coffeatum]|uniref:Microbial-type PARG catalytic domain-containing protein n=1 Tax=Fusarium coffeatum TaxID=231269 RepID=A0A366SAS1_9HYPO|nr:uncharacterized protein FIESC28_01468 [Fusarium coffeatum]RBR25715.1 hypothetical protein FIESC28_01468 [Fusarium coffeatum]
MTFFPAYMEFKALLSGEVDYEALASQRTAVSASGSNQRNQSSSNSGPSRPHDHTRYKHRQENRATAQETLSVLPDLLEELGTEDKAEDATRYSFESLHQLHPAMCPHYPQPATIKVVNSDTLNAAIDLSGLFYGNFPNSNHGSKPPLVVNFANRHSPGGGWLNGAMAQEEGLCYRSSLAMSLDKSLYPMERSEAIYSPYVLIMRQDLASGHAIMNVPARDLPVVSAVTVAALHKPPVKTLKTKMHDEYEYETSEPGKRVFANDRGRDTTKAKIRLCLRMAAVNRHDMLVLGALGCGVYSNPPEDVAHCWLEVLREHEFSGNWWREVWFAVFDPKKDGNFEVFQNVLDGQEV